MPAAPQPSIEFSRAIIESMMPCDSRERPWRQPGRDAAALAAALCLAAAAQGETHCRPRSSAALQRARVPASALSVLLQEAGSGRTLLAVQAREPVNPASLAKLLTTYAALDLLGPAWTWATPVWLTGPVQDGVLDGDLVIKGQGDPTLVLERVWLLLRRVQQLGVREIAGDIVLDHSAFAPSGADPADFDGEALRPTTCSPTRCC
jgi:serine-type D-Ala-D-Ala carboxypeptidase/endopeptidase (penicillin-binding protein 4)